MKSKFNKIINHIKDHGFFNTIRWLYNCVIFRLMRKKVKSIDFDKVEIENKDMKYLVSKTGPNIFIVASIPYYDIGGGQRCSQLAKTFNKMGFNVIYLYAFKSSESKVFDIPMPMSAHIFIDEKTVDKIKDMTGNNDLFIFEAPSEKFKDILDLAIEKKSHIIYENIDNWETTLGNTVFNRDILKKMLTHADLLVGTAKPLVEQLNKYLKEYKIKDKKVMYLANAVDDELFCGLKNLEKPKDLVVDKLTFLYYGSLWGEWFDWDIIIDLALKYPRYSFNIIGDYANISNVMQNCPHNIHFLGLKRQSDLPNYLKYVDFTLIPFKPGEIGDYVSPLKIFEYISMYTKVICTKLPDVEGYPNVYTGNTLKEWEKIIDANYEVDKEKADKFIGNNSWCNRVTNMLDIIYPDLSNSMFKDNLSIIILNYNNKNIIFKSLNSLLEFNKIYNYEIIVVDNGSTDGSYELLKKKYDGKIKIVRNEKNGCSSGRNLGVKQATKKYLLFLDSDQWVTNKYWLLSYENLLKSDSNIHLIGWAAGFFNNKNRAYHVVDSFPYRYMPSSMLGRIDIGYLGSGGMLMLKEDFEKLEGFDTEYDPTCYEDTDLSMKFRDAFEDIYYCPYLGIIHLPHQTTKSGSDEHTKLINEKQKYFTEKWMNKNSQVFKYKK